MTARLGLNQFGKAEVRLVRVTRDTPRHQIADLCVTTQLHGDFAATHLRGDNAGVIATDTQKNTVYAFAKQHGITTPDAFLLLLAEHFVAEYEHVTGGRFTADAYAWSRIEDADHAFVRQGGETRTATVLHDGERLWLVQGLTDLVVLKSTGSEFGGFPRDRWTSLPDAKDRILATSVTARWLLDVPDPAAVDHDAVYERVRALLLSTFAGLHSLALQQTLYAMGEAVLEQVPEVAEVRFSMPNRHHFLVDLAPFGLENPNEVFFAADRPYGLIEASVIRDGFADGHPVWSAVTSFC